MKKAERLHFLLRNIFRIGLALLFLFSSTVKGIDILGTTYKFEEYFLGSKLTSLIPMSFAMALILTTAEFMIGVCLLFNIKTKLASWGMLLFMAFFTILTFLSAFLNNVSDCGCFGDALKLSNWQTFYKNLIIDIFAVYVFWHRRKFKNIVIKKSLILSVIAFVGFQAFVFHCYYNLPIIDFRPYKIGTNVKKLLEVPANAPKDVYDYVITYEKQGVQKDFTLKNLPDSTWTWKETKMELVKKGYQSPLMGFEIMSYDNVDITNKVLNDDYAFLLVSYDLKEANVSKQARINDVAQMALSLTYGFYCLTSSPQIEYDRFKFKHQVPYLFYKMDEKVLKTIIRSNPGLVLMKNGVVVDMWHFRNIPTPEEMDKKLEKY